jgi:phosphoribosyl 1,2-cyclic phosphodiesterase
LDGLIITHCHADHYTDAEVFIEAMTDGTRAKQGVLSGTKSVLRGSDGLGPCISGYHQALVRDLIEMYEGTAFSVGELGFTATEARHSDPYSVGLRVSSSQGNIGYTSDTGYFAGLADSYTDLRLLVLCTMWPRGNPINIHLNTDGALRVLEESQPKVCILTHFGMRMLNAGPEEEAAYLQEETGIPVVAARDGLKAQISDVITLQGPRKADEPMIIDA